jgi:hypothetical protein
LKDLISKISSLFTLGNDANAWFIKYRGPGYVLEGLKKPYPLRLDSDEFSGIINLSISSAICDGLLSQSSVSGNRNNNCKYKNSDLSSRRQRFERI